QASTYDDYERRRPGGFHTGAAHADLAVGACIGRTLRTVEDGVPADPAPADGWLAVDLDQLECGAGVGASEGPGHLEDAGRAREGAHPQPRRPAWKPAAASFVVCLVHCPNRNHEEALVPVGEPAPVRPEARRLVVLHQGQLGGRSRISDSGATS